MYRIALGLALALAAATVRGEVQLVIDGESFIDLGAVVYDAGPRRMSLSFGNALACRPPSEPSGFGLLTLAIGGQEFIVPEAVTYLAAGDNAVLSITTNQGPPSCAVAAIFQDRFALQP